MPATAAQTIALMLSAIRLFHRLKAAGTALEAVNAEGAGVWGVLRDLAKDGPLTVPALVKRRPVSRQYMQRVVDDLAKRGLVETRTNPRHRRSVPIALTKEGARHAAKLEARVMTEAGRLAVHLDRAEVEQALAALERENALLGAEIAASA